MTPLETEALLLSLRVAGWSVLLDLPLGLAAAWVLARSRFPGKFLFDGIVHLPLIVPPVVVGYLLLVGLGRNGWIGAWLYDVFGLTLTFSWRGAAVASAVMSFPLMVRAIRLSIEAVDRRLEEAARTLGASPAWVFLTVTLPQIRFAVVTSALLSFLTSFDEVVVAMFVSGGDNPTLTRNMFNALRDQIDPTIASISTIMILVTTGMMVLAQIFGQQKTKPK